MDVRAAATADVAAIQRVARRAWHAAHEPIVGEQAVAAFLDEYYGEETLRERIAGEADLFFVAVDEAVVGFAAARSVDEPGLYGLGNLYVDPDRWGEGIGSRLLGRVERAVRERDGDRVRLAVMAENDRAVGFYESAGYERVREGYDDRLEVARYFYARDL